MKQGLFIAVEGIDGSGKSTFVKALADLLTAHTIPVIITKEPGGSSLGLQVRTIVQESNDIIDPIAEFLLFAADRAQHFSSIIIPTLAQGCCVISDRCADSSVAYQGYGRGLSLSMIDQVNAWAMQGYRPDITFYLAIDIQTARVRSTKRNEKVTRFEQERDQFFNRVTAGFQAMYASRADVIILDAQRPVADLRDYAFEIIKKMREQQ